MEKHNPSSFTVDSSSPAHRSSFAIHDLTPYINWIYFFHAWGFQPRYAAIANIHGCDSCRAIWLTTFPEEERGKASEAMQLYKEANRMLNELDRDFEVKTIFKLCPANADANFSKDCSNPSVSAFFSLLCPSDTMMRVFFHFVV